MKAKRDRILTCSLHLLATSLGLALLSTGCGGTQTEPPMPIYSSSDGGGPNTQSSCSPNQLADCTCPSGKSSKKLCSADGNWNACACESVGTCYGSKLQVIGQVATSHKVINYTGGEVTGGLVHKLDVDPEENGCVGGLTLRIALPGGGCPIELTFGKVEDSRPNTFGLTNVQLTADSECPGFLDADEGYYNNSRRYDANYEYGAFWFSGPTVVPQQTQSSICISGVTIGFTDNPIHLRNWPKLLTINLKDLFIIGDIRSTGLTTSQCLPSSKLSCGALGSELTYDGGDGWCSKWRGNCSPGFFDDGEGRCVSSCKAGLHKCGDTCVSSPTQIECNNQCVETNEDESNCGGCGRKCTDLQFCSGGRCIDMSKNGYYASCNTWCYSLGKSCNNGTPSGATVVSCESCSCKGMVSLYKESCYNEIENGGYCGGSYVSLPDYCSCE